MEQVYDIFKSFVDPVFIIFILLLIMFFIYLASSKKKIDMLPLLFVIILLYGFSIFPVSNYLSYQLEKEYISPAAVKDKMTPDVIVVLSGGASDINALDETFPEKRRLSGWCMRCRCLKNTMPGIWSVPGKATVR